MNRGTLAAAGVAVVGALACSAVPGTAPSTAPTASGPPTAVATVEVVSTIPVPPTTVPLPTGAGDCAPTATAAFDVYTRPSLMAQVFGTFAPDVPPVSITGRTADGWLGFDPGVPQAANIGVFRLRWIPPGAPVSLSGDCASVPVEPWVPAPGVCYQMSMGPVEVHTAADPASSVSHTLMVGEFVTVTGQTGTGWLFVNGNDGNVPGVIGFIPQLEMNANGPCESIPVVSP